MIQASAAAVADGLLIPPVEAPWTPIRDFLALSRDPLSFFTQMARRHGRLVWFYVGPQRTLFVNEPDLVREVLVTRHKAFVKDRGIQLAKRMIGEGLLSSEGEFHKRQRRLAQPAFHRERIIAYGEQMARLASRGMERWRNGATVDLNAEMMRITLAIVGKTLFGTEVESEAEELGAAITESMEMFKFVLFPFIELLEKLPLPVVKRFEESKERLDRTIYRMIDEHRRSPDDNGDLLTMLLRAQDTEGDGSGMTDLQLRDEALTIFLAGHETTANALSWTWYLLSRHPEIEARLHAEVDAVLQGRLPGAADAKRLPYTERVLTESMRLYSPAWGIGRIAAEPVEIGRAKVRPGDGVLVSQWVMHRDPVYYPGPERFDPDRWRPEVAATRPKFSYFPFGAGPRLCIGESFAWMEGVLLLATMAQRWRFHLAPGHRVVPQPRITLRQRYGLRVRLERRRPAFS